LLSSINQQKGTVAMPLVQITTYSGRFRRLSQQKFLTDISTKIRGLVAGALHCKGGGELQADEVEVRIGELPFRWQHTDIGRYDFKMIVIANELPARKKGLGLSLEVLTRAVQALLPEGAKGYIWILLCPAAFGEFEGK
jgi:hypothetical protein